ncbi:family 16 glycoside hydrolase, partial [Salmonella enterica]|uniref:family 16 glycoside hydrolase n=1 Tax=Salmonella enterica TaxID=28901 RepID=UPI0022B62586
MDNDGHSDAKIEKHRAGDLYDLIKSSSEPVKPAGEWNTAEIVSKNGKLTLLLNGVYVVETKLWDDNFKALIAGSKFANWP